METPSLDSQGRNTGQVVTTRPYHRKEPTMKFSLIAAALAAVAIQLWSGVSAGAIAIDSIATRLVARDILLQRF